MGHKEGHSLAYNHRLLAAAQRKIGSFILVFSVILIAWIIFLAAIHNRESSCQQRAHIARYHNILAPSVSYDDIVAVVNTVFAQRRVSMTVTEERKPEVTVELLDTEAGILSNNGFRLLRWRDKSWVKWDLRTFSTHMCGATPTVSMEILPNVDYEKAQYRSIALSIPHLGNNTQEFVLSSELSSTDMNRISSFVQLESVFPGFYALSSADDKVTVQQSYSVVERGSGEVYFGATPLDIQVEFQEWMGSGSTIFWGLSLSSSDIHSQTALRSLQKSIEVYLVDNNLFCQEKTCKATSVPFLL